MKFLSSLLLFAVIAMSQGLILPKPYYNVNDAPALFKKYMKDFDRHYKNEADKELHYLAFTKKLIDLNQENALPGDARYGINGLSDYTPEEVHEYLDGPDYSVHKGKIPRKRSNNGY